MVDLMSSIRYLRRYEVSVHSVGY